MAVIAVLLSVGVSRNATASLPGPVRLTVPIGHFDKVTAVAFSPDSNYALTGSADGTACVWEVTSKRLLQRFDAESSVLAIASSVDNTRVLLGTLKGIAYLFSPVSNASPITLAGHGSRINTVALSRDQRYGFTGSDDHTVTMWDLKRAVTVRTFSDPQMGAVRSIALSSDGKHLITGGGDPVVRIWDVRSGRIAHALSVSAQEVTSVAISESGRLLAVGSDDRKVRIWDAQSAALPREFGPFSAPIVAVGFSSNDTVIELTTDDGVVRRRNAGTGEVIRTFNGFPDSIDAVTQEHRKIKAVAFSTNGKYAIGAIFSSALLEDLTMSPEAIRSRQVEVGFGAGIGNTVIDSVDFTSDGQYLVSRGDVWSLETGRLLRHGAEYSIAVLSRGGSWLLTTEPTDTAHVQETATGKEVGTYHLPSRFIACAGWQPDGCEARGWNNCPLEPTGESYRSDLRRSNRE
jgi:WD40 repeat protein